MIKSSILKTIVFSMLVLFTYAESVYAQKVKITTSPQTAKILVNGQQMGTGEFILKLSKNSKYTVDITAEGWESDSRTYYSMKGMPSPPKQDYVVLQPDPLYTSTTQSDIVNNEIALNVKPGRTKEEAWKIIISTILNKFDVLENNDERLGYLRTSWVGTTFKSNTVRIRVIVKLSSDDPLSYKFKFVSEESGKSGTAFNADEQYRPYNRMQKKYDGFVDELMTKLRN